MEPPATPKPPAAAVREQTWRGRALVICVVLLLGTLAVYWPVHSHQFVNYDDPGYVTENYHVLEGFTWEGVRWAFITSHTANWHPLTWLSHMADCQLFGAKPGAQHLVNVLFHAANSLLLFLVLRRMTGTLWRSAFVAALFAWHPLHVESVAWVSERKDVLSTCFWLLALLAYVRYAGSPKAEGRGPKESRKPKAESRTARAELQAAGQEVSSSRGRLYYALSLLFFMLALMSKPMVVTFPFVLLLLDYWPLGRWQVPTGQPHSGSAALALLKEKLPFFLLVIPSCIVTFIFQRGAGAVSTLTALPLPARVANALIAYPRYLGKMLWPSNLAVLYPHPMHWPGWQVALAGLLLAELTYLAVWAARRQPYWLVGWLWFLGTLVPVIGLVQAGAQSIADRYTYVPLIGPFVAGTWGLCALSQRIAPRGPLLGVGAAAVLIACLLCTRVQLGYWVDSEALFGHAIQVTRDNTIAYNNRGLYLAGKRRIADAKADFQAALKIEPHNADAHSNLGSALAGEGKLPEAIAHYAEALKTRPEHSGAHYNLGQAYENIGKTKEAMAEYELALRAKPEYADAHNNLGIALAADGNLQDAERHLRAAVRTKPDFAEAHNNLGSVLTAQGKPEAAVAEFAVVLRLKPDYLNAHMNLAAAWSRMGNTHAALQEYETVLRLNPNESEARDRKAELLSSAQK